MIRILFSWLRAAGHRLGQAHTALPHNAEAVLRASSEWAGGLPASAPNPCHPLFPKDLLFSSCFSFPFSTLQHSLFPVSSTLCSVSAQGCPG